MACGAASGRAGRADSRAPFLVPKPGVPGQTGPNGKAETLLGLVGLPLRNGISAAHDHISVPTREHENASNNV